MFNNSNFLYVEKPNKKFPGNDEEYTLAKSTLK